MGRKLGLYKDKKHSERSSAHGTRNVRKIRSRCGVEEACGVSVRWHGSHPSTALRMLLLWGGCFRPV